MSRGLSMPGVYPRSYWTYTALVMTRRLDKIADAREINGEEIPKGVLRSAQTYFEIFREILTGEKSPNLLAANDLFVFSLEVLEDVGVEARSGESHATAQMRILSEFEEFMRRITEGRKLTSEEVATAKYLSRFLMQVRRIGSAERYLDVVAGSDCDDC